MNEPILRPEMEQFEKRVGEGFTHLNNGVDSIQEAIVLLSSSIVELKITQESVLTTMKGQERILDMVTGTESRCNQIEYELDNLKTRVTAITVRLKEEAIAKKDEAKWKKRLSVTTVVSLMLTSFGLIIKDIFFK